MNSLKPAFTPFHAPAGLKRLLVAVLAVLLLGVLTALPALASGSGTWTTTGSMNTVREGATMTRLQNGQVLVAGGYDNSLNFLASAELYNPATGQWTLTGSMNVSRGGAAATLLPNGKVLVAGGETYDDNFNTVELTSAELYTPATGTWTYTGSMIVANAAPATLLQNGQVLVAGGSDARNLSIASAELYTPSTSTWTLTGSMSTAREGHTMTQLSNGQVLVAGGDDYAANGSRQVLTSAELYTPATGTWTLTGSMNVARTHDSATLLTGGQVLVAGGHGLNVGIAFTSAELYNPATGTWTLTGSLNVARQDAPTTLLTGGQVLIAGGASGYYALASAELYTP